MTEGKKEKHPSYGMIGLYRTTGGVKKLFGSSLSNHPSYITLVISEATRKHDLHNDWYYGSTKSIIEVMLSHEQFAQLITNINMGSGVPCTIHSINNKSVDPYPDDDTEIDRIKDGIKDKISSLTTPIERLKVILSELKNKKRVSKIDIQELINIVDMLSMDLESNLPFIADQFNKATAKIVTSAKAEIEAFINMTVMKTGIKQLKSMKPNHRLLDDGSSEG